MHRLAKRALATAATAALVTAGLVTVAAAATAATTADLAVSYTAAPASITTSQSATYTVTVTNNGPDSGGFSDIEFQNSGPVASVAPPGGKCTTSGETIDCTGGVLSSGASVSFTYTVTPSGTGTLLTGAVLTVNSTTTTDPALGNNSAVTSTTVTAPQCTDLELSLAATAGPLLTSQITYGLSVHDNGPAAASTSSVQIALPSQVYSVTGLPAGCTYTSSTDTVTCTTGAIADGATANVSFKANLNLLSLGSLPATATLASSTPADSDAGNNTSSITCTTLTSLIISCPATPF
jgi:hypothetical protein